VRIGAVVASLFLLMAGIGVVCAQSPREQLSQMVEQLQKTPVDNALRERIIKLAKELKPPPAINEAAERHLARGRAAFRSAKEAADYKDAVREFSQASLAAPWLHDAYYNLGVAQDKAGEYRGAMQSLKLAMLSAPTADEAKSSRDLLYEVEFREEKARAAARTPDLSRLQGIWSVKDQTLTFYYRIQVAGDVIRFSAYRYESPRDSQDVPPGHYGEYRLKVASGAFQGIYVEGNQIRPCAGRESPASAIISSDGQELTVTLKQMFGWGERNGMVDAKSCVQKPKPEYRFTLRRQ